MRHRIIVTAAFICALASTGIWAQRGAGPGPAGTPAAPIGLIVGRVVDAGTGDPVPEAEVTVAMRTPAPPGSNPFAGPAGLRLLTGPDGRFVVRDLPAGNVQLSVRAPGYLNGSYGQTRPAGPPRPIQITAENRMVSASVRLWKHAVVTGMVTDERNEPAININVRVMMRSYRGGQARFAPSGLGRTDDRGMYRIAGLSPGDYIVAVPQAQTAMPAATMDDLMQSMLGGQGIGAAAAELAASGAVAAGAAGAGGAGVRVGDQIVNSQSGALAMLSAEGPSAAYLTQYYPAVSTPAEAAVVTLASGEERGNVDIKMPLVPTARVSGTVVGPDGPLANVQVRLVNVAEADSGDNFTDVARAVTAANGGFQLFGVPAGQYVAKVLRTPRPPLPASVASNPQLAALMGGRMGGPASPSDSLTLFADVPLSVDRDVTDLMITLSTGATVSGRVEFVGAAAVPPMAGVIVRLALPGGGAPEFARPSPVGEDGRFTTLGAAAGKYFISVTGRTPGWFAKSAMVNGIDALDQPFELTTEDIGNVVVTYTDRQATIAGTVIGASGAPAEGTVVVFPAAYREWIARGMATRLTRSVRAQSQGTFTIGGLPGRDYFVVALADDQLPDLQNPTVYEALARAATSVTVSDGDTRNVSIKLSQVVR